MCYILSGGTAKVACAVASVRPGCRHDSAPPERAGTEIGLLALAHGGESVNLDELTTDCLFKDACARRLASVLGGNLNSSSIAAQDFNLTRNVTVIELQEPEDVLNIPADSFVIVCDLGAFAVSSSLTVLPSKMFMDIGPCLWSSRWLRWLG